MKNRTSSLRQAIVAVAVVVLALAVACSMHHTRVEKFVLTWYPDQSYAPARLFPETDPNGEPKVVLVRRANDIECFAVYYSRDLKSVLEGSPSRQVEVTYRVSFRFGKAYWIETLDTAGLGIRPISISHVMGQNGRGECF